ncbi:response regulator transcription factor [Amycolatopsis mongoliensis]|uniref:Response regulator transcription factor n=1 Tax=Amycolatopsis mongoliensis TaxID=715475 RepID=A0A9Y2JQ64_9PSEU|nr:response regulator transcription factor [Amycolatopsis sp. 4-36]WIY01611.1 response regulator transcription factor [Amycolatopsis sp. 4-36]
MSAQPHPLRIIIADDQASVREGLVLLLGLLPDFEVVDSAANGREALDQVTAHQPDAVLLDLHMPELDGVDTTRRLVQHHPGVAIVILTTYRDDASVLAALRAGARGYLTKDASREEIAHALRSAAAGLAVLDPDVQLTLLNAADHGGPADVPIPEPLRTLPDGLTAREGEILAMIARGKTNPDIARELVLSSHTIKSHINRIFAKTRSGDRAAAIRYAREHHLA